MAKDIIFAPLPMEQQIQVSRHIRPMLSYLEQRLNSPISINYFNDYADILNQFSLGHIDLTFLGPLPYIQLRKEYSQAIPVVRFLNAQGDETYTCSIITWMESGIHSLQSLVGKQIALTQPGSTCGYLMAGKILHEADISIETTQYRYTGSHQEVALSVVRGESDAGAIQTAIGRKYSHLGLRFLSESETLPGFLLVANGKTLTAEQIGIIRNSLLQLMPLSNPDHHKLTSSWGGEIRNGAVVVTDEYYNMIRRELEKISIPATGNF